MAQPAPAVLSAFDIQALISYLDQEPAPMMVMNTEYEILAANTAYQRQFGTVGRSYVGHKCYAVSHGYTVPCDQAGEHCPLQRALASKGPDRVLHVHHTPRGPEHVDIELRPIIDAEHRVVGFVERLLTIRHASAQPSREGLVGQAPAFNRALAELQRVAPSSLPVLLLGESGTGKELFARAVHEASPRARGPFVVVDCSGLTETLFESELFGYEKGAFTGALNATPGKFEQADGGTLLLDEISEMPLTLQAKLLRVLQEREVERVGARKPIAIDIRVLATSNRDMLAEVRAGRFREDLYYRLNVFPLHNPPLRERRADILPLARRILARGVSRGARPRHTLSAAAEAALTAYGWPGNIRELENVMQRAMILAPGDVIDAGHLALPKEAAVPPDREQTGPAEDAAMPADMRSLERKHILDMLSAAKGVRKVAAERLGMSERTLRYKLQQYRGEGYAVPGSGQDDPAP